MTVESPPAVGSAITRKVLPVTISNPVVVHAVPRFLHGLRSYGIRLYLGTPRLRAVFHVAAEADRAGPQLAAIDLHRLEACDFVVGGRRYQTFHLDLERESAAAYYRRMLQRATAGPGAANPAPSEPLVRLRPGPFATAVRAALRQLAAPVERMRRPLTESRLVWLRAGVGADHGARARALHALLMEAIDSLAGSPSDIRGRTALLHTYVDPAPVQKQAAQALGVGFSTYRRHLTEGIARVVDMLWQQERED
jgi:hypothetical protein